MGKIKSMPRNINRRYVQDTEFALWAVKRKVNGFSINQIMLAI